MTAMYNADYTPDNWVVLKITNTKRSGNTGYGRTEEVLYKVLAGWSGSYLNGNSWRINSGITLVFDREDEVHFHGESGSLYRCHKETYGLRMSTAGVYKKMCLQQEFNGQIILMPEDTDWSKLV